MSTKEGVASLVADPTRININLLLNDISLKDLLDAICLVSDQPIKYSVEDYGIVFSTNGSYPQYEMRAFKINSYTFISKLMTRVGYNGPIPDASNVIKIAEQFFLKLGVNLDPPKTVNYNDRDGIFFVYATPQDLKVIEKAIQNLIADPPQVHIKARFFEVPKKFFSSAAAKSLPANMTNGEGRLTTTESKKVLQLLESQKGCEEMAEPEITTLSERQARMFVGQPVLTNFSDTMPYLFPPDVNADVTTSDLDVVPVALSDGYTVRLSVTATWLDGFGSVDIRPTLPGLSLVAVPVPALQLSSASLHRAVYDGQTIVLFPAPVKPSSVEVTGEKLDEKSQERVAEFIRKSRKELGEQVVVVLCTVTLVDGTGRRIHSDEDVPFAHSYFPQESSSDFLPTGK